MYKDLDPILHSQLRLAMISMLMANEEVDFNYIREVTNATSGNISVQIKNLQEAGYIEVRKSFKNNYQNTTLKITQKGILAFEKYVESLKQYIKMPK
jgi:DNA-binding MarR family transcriptional regulator